MEVTDIDIIDYSDSEEAASSLKRESSKTDSGLRQDAEQHSAWSTTAKTAAVVTLSLVCGTCYAGGSLFSVVAQTDGIGSCYLGFFNGVVAVALLSPYMVAMRHEAIPQTRGDAVLTVGIGILGTIATLTLQYNPTVSLGNITALLFASMPVFTALFACILGQERCKPVHLIAAVFGFTGIFLITRPRFVFQFSDLDTVDKYEGVSYALTLLASLSVSLGHVLGRAVRGRVSVLTIMFFIGGIRCAICGALFVSLPLTVDHVTPKAASCIIGISVFSLLGTWCRFQGLRFEHATTFALLLNFEVVASYILDRLCFDFQFAVTDIIGASLIVVCSGIVAFVSKRERNKEEKEETISEVVSDVPSASSVPSTSSEEKQLCVQTGENAKTDDEN